MFARYRSVGHRLGERAVLLDRIPASARGAGGALRFGPDGKIYLALDDAANGRTAGSLASYNGKVLRLNADATTPDDRTPFSPIDSPVFRDNLFVAAEAGRHLIRFQFDSNNAERIIAAERLMQDQIGPVRVVAMGPDEALYVASDTALFRLAP